MASKTECIESLVKHLKESECVSPNDLPKEFWVEMGKNMFYNIYIDRRWMTCEEMKRRAVDVLQKAKRLPNQTKINESDGITSVTLKTHDEEKTVKINKGHFTSSLSFCQSGLDIPSMQKIKYYGYWQAVDERMALASKYKRSMITCWDEVSLRKKDYFV